LKETVVWEPRVGEHAPQLYIGSYNFVGMHAIE
jgi:hypothetical protein